MFVEPKQKYKYNCLRKCWKLSLLHKISLYVALSPGRHNIIPIIAVLSPFISSKKFERNFYSQVQGCSGVGKAFPHLFTLDYIETWLWSHGCASDMQIRTASKSLQWNRKIQCRNTCRRHFIRTIWCSLPFYLVWKRLSHTSFFNTTPLVRCKY